MTNSRIFNGESKFNACRIVLFNLESVPPVLAIARQEVTRRLSSSSVIGDIVSCEFSCWDVAGPDKTKVVAASIESNNIIFLFFLSIIPPP